MSSFNKVPVSGSLPLLQLLFRVSYEKAWGSCERGVSSEEMKAQLSFLLLTCALSSAGAIRYSRLVHNNLFVQNLAQLTAELSRRAGVDHWVYTSRLEALTVRGTAH